MHYSPHRVWTDGEVFEEGVYTLFQTKTTDADGNYVGDRVGPADVETHPGAPSRPTPDPYWYDPDLGCGCISGLMTSASLSGFVITDDFTLVDYSPKFKYTT